MRTECLIYDGAILTCSCEQIHRSILQLELQIVQQIDEFEVTLCQKFKFGDMGESWGNYKINIKPCRTRYVADTQSCAFTLYASMRVVYCQSLSLR